MSDEELSLWIAEFLEPKPDEACTEDDVEFTDDGWRVFYSPIRMWMRFQKPTTFQEKGWHLVKRDMVNDPAMTVMLVKNLMPKLLSITSNWNGASHYWQVQTSFDTDQDVPATNKDFGRAVAEAFAMAHGCKDSTAPPHPALNAHPT